MLATGSDKSCIGETCSSVLPWLSPLMLAGCMLQGDSGSVNSAHLFWRWCLATAATLEGCAALVALELTLCWSFLGVACVCLCSRASKLCRQKCNDWQMIAFEITSLAWIACHSYLTPCWRDRTAAKQGIQYVIVCKQFRRYIQDQSQQVLRHVLLQTDHLFS